MVDAVGATTTTAAATTTTTTTTKRSAQERENLRNVIAQWNANRLDLFELSEPNEDLEFHGVMRFYFQDAGQKVATKCIRVASSATTTTVIETLIEKFRPDLRMLSIPEYALYEIHESGDERKLGEYEKPLLVQLNWHKDDREGRFLLRRMDEKTFVTHQSLEDGTHFKRKLSKREKKEKKKREKIQKAKIIEEAEDDKDGIAEKLYTEMPETSFTRSISNPEAVMRRRRQQKLEKKLQQFRSKDGGPDTGGTLKIYGESLCKDVPYKTLLLSVRDNAAFVVKEMLDKYGLDRDDPSSYCLVQVLVDTDRDSRDYSGNNGVPKEVILDDDECPLAILMNYHPSRGSPIFHIQKRPGDYQQRKRKKRPKSAKGGDPEGYYFADESSERMEPFFQELNPDGSDVTSCAPKRYTLGPNVTEVGSERGVSTNVQHLQLFGPNVYPRHCVVAHTDGIVTVTPCNRDAETYVNWQRIHETTILQHGMVIRFGKIHCFRFLDPVADERRHRRDSVGRHQGDNSYDRHSMKDDNSLHHSFENDGNVETVSTSSLKEDLHSEISGKENRIPHNTMEMQRRGHDPILPAILELWDDGEDPFLASTVSGLDTAAVQFKLAPTYTLYMASRFRASTHYRPEIAPTERAHRLTVALIKVANKIQAVIQDRCLEAGSLAFWMANSSELLHFLKQDRHLSPFCVDAQDILGECVQIAFRNLVHCMQNELLNAMPAFLEDRDDVGEEEGTSGEILAVLSSAMALLRRCRVNAALTIQLFSQLFHFINMWLFNRVVCEPRPILCTRLWGVRLKCRLARVEMWAEKQGLELAADCHLSRILQAADLLQSPKSTSDDLAAISSSCFKLNSLQLRSLLERYQPSPDEPNIPHLLIENVIKVAENTADEMARSDGRDVRLEEDPDLQLPFLLPEDGYSCDIVRGVPAGLQEFVSPFQRAGLCRLTIQPSSSGFWTIYMTEHELQRNNHGPRSQSAQSYPVEREPTRVTGSSQEPEVAAIKLQKSNNGMGLSIVAARGVGQDKLGIYIKSVVKGGAADSDGRLQAGDQLLKVDGQSLVGISQEKAAEYMTRTGPVVQLEVAKEGAMYHGLATLLSQPSPVIHRAGSGYPGTRRLSERDIHSKVLREQNQDCINVSGHGHGGSISGGGGGGGPSVQPRMQSSKSVPSLNSGVDSSPHSEPFWTPLSTNGLRPQQEQQQHQQQQPYDTYNPAYSRTSSTTSIVRTGQQEMAANRDQTMRARSTNNLRQQSYPLVTGQQQGPTSRPPHPNIHNGNNEEGGQQRGRPLSQPNLQHEDEERHYQNISLYQQQQTQPSHRPKHPPISPQSSYPTPPGPNVPSPVIKSSVGFGQLDDRMSQRMRGSQGSLYRPPDQFQQQQQQPQRPVSALLPHWDKDTNSGPVSPSTRHAPGQFSRAGVDPRYQQQPLQQQQTRPQDVPGNSHTETLHRSGSDAVNSSDHGSEKHGRQSDGAWRNERDVFRQEAKMEEMREEIRRREERMTRERKIQELQQQQQNHHQQQRLTGNPGSVRFEHQQQQQNQGNHLMRGPPPTTPKPRFGLVGHPAQAQQQRPLFAGQDLPPERPPLPPDELLAPRDVMQPPPPPPSSTHPLYHHQGPSVVRGPATTAVSYRYGPGGLPLSRSTEHFDRLPSHESHSRNMAVTNQLNQLANQANHRTEMGLNSGSSSSLLLSPSPWEREERERERKRRLDEARRLRDQEIDELEATQRSAKQEERLRTLRLEKEFQRRADELIRNQNDDDEENEEEDDTMDRRGFLRLVQEDLERARVKRLERENDRIQKQQQQDEMRRQHSQERQFPPHLDPSRPQSIRRDTVQQQQQQQQQTVMGLHSPPNRSEEWLRRQQDIKEQRRELQQQEEQQHILIRERQQRLDEANRKREHKKEQERLALRELQNAREAEERLLREAQKRQEEDIRRERAIQQQHQQQLYHHQKNMSMLSMPSGQYVGHPMDNGHLQGHQQPFGSSGAQRLDTLLMSQQQQHLQYAHTNGGAVGTQAQQPPVPPPPPERKGSYDTMAQIEGQWDGQMSPPVPAKEGKRVSFHDSRMVVTEEAFATPPNQQLSMTSTFTVGSTPGVIGAQEVYRDPRQRIEASRRGVDGFPQNTPKGPGPEQLSFREKMKKFALETGEDNTPRDKVKISKAQREIESNMTNCGGVPGATIAASTSVATTSVHS